MNPPPHLPAAFTAYARRGHRSVHGWLDPVAIDALATIAAAQAQRGISGGVAEIGIHHGRLFILLALQRAPGERAAAYDLFEQQGENVDASGRGDRAVFLENLLRHGVHGRLRVRTCNSLALTPDEVRADAGPVRLFSVDGGHTAEITASDLALAEAALCPGGVVVLDDFFNQAWPGVAEGAARYLLSGASRLVPVFIGGNKFAFTTSPEHASMYQGDLLQALTGRLGTHAQIAFGHAVLVLQPAQLTLVRRLAATRLWAALRTTRVGRLLRTLALRLLAR